MVCPRVTLVWADGGYARVLVKPATKHWWPTAQIVKRTDAARGIVVLPRRGVVERSFAHPANAQRTICDHEGLEVTHEATVHQGTIRMTTCLAIQHTT